MSEPTDPTVPVVAPPTQLMTLASALRQAAIDIPKDLPPGVGFGYSFREGEGHSLEVVVKATDRVGGQVVWSQTYDRHGRRVHQVAAGGFVSF